MYRILIKYKPENGKSVKEKAQIPCQNDHRYSNQNQINHTKQKNRPGSFVIFT